METSIQTVNGKSITRQTTIEKIEALQANIEVIQTVMSKVMKKGEHYDKIPGTEKPTLLKAGAEKLSFVFRLSQEYEIQEKELENNHREYRVVCRLSSIESNQFLGTGVGICTTLETKYRYRNEWKKEPTGKPVPADYWGIRKQDSNRAQELIGGKGFRTEKTDEGWMIFKVESTEKSENQNIADTYNTVLKIAKKRAFVDATLSVTGASDIFIQDMEEKDPEETRETKEPYKSNSPENAGDSKNSYPEAQLKLWTIASREHCTEFFKTNGRENFKKSWGVEIAKLPGEDKYKYVPLGTFDRIRNNEPIQDPSKRTEPKIVNGSKAPVPVGAGNSRGKETNYDEELF